MVPTSFEPGYELSFDEVSAFFYEPWPEIRTVINYAEHTRRGVSIVPPNQFDSANIYVHDDGNVFEQLTDWTRITDHFGRIIFRGNNLSGDELLNVNVDLIVSLEIETTFALKFRFVADRFGDDAPAVNGYRAVAWIDKSDGITDDWVAQMHARLIERSTPYRILDEFFLEPRSPQFRELFDDVIGGRGFGRAYELAN